MLNPAKQPINGDSDASSANSTANTNQNNDNNNDNSNNTNSNSFLNNEELKHELNRISDPLAQELETIHTWLKQNPNWKDHHLQTKNMVLIYANLISKGHPGALDELVNHFASLPAMVACYCCWELNNYCADIAVPIMHRFIELHKEITHAWDFYSLCFLLYLYNYGYAKAKLTSPINFHADLEQVFVARYPHLTFTLARESTDNYVGQKFDAGAYATIYLQKHHKIECALKVFDETKYPKWERVEINDAVECYKNYINELLILSAVKHEHLVNLLGCNHGPKSKLFLQFANQGSLFKYVENQPVTEKQILVFGGQIWQGLMALHAMKIFHRDLKATNVVVNVDSEPKAIIIDVGAGSIGPDSVDASRSCVTTYTNAAPEILLIANLYNLLDKFLKRIKATEQEGLVKYSVKSEIYAFAITLYTLVEKSFPFLNEPRNFYPPNYNDLFEISHAVAVNGRLPLFTYRWNNYPADFIQLYNGMTEHDPRKRTEPEQITQYFQQLNKL